MRALVPEIVQVRSKRELREFLMLPFDLYRDDPNWVPPLLLSEKKLLDRRSHPFHQHAKVEYFLAIRDGRPVGRIAGIVNDIHNRHYHDRTGFWGFFESEPSEETARRLFQAAEQFLRQHGMTASRGPTNPSINETLGMLVDGFDSMPVFMMTYNPPTYPKFVEASGYRKVIDLLAYHSTIDVVKSEPFQRLKRHFESSPVKIRPIDLRDFQSEIRTLMDIYNDAWSNNWGFVPMTEAEVEFMARDLKQIFRPDLSYMAECDGKIVGFAFALPDINPIVKSIHGRLLPFGWLKLLFGLKRVSRVRVMGLGVRRAYQHLGIGVLFCLKFIEDGQKTGVRAAEMSWILESNRLMIQPLERMGAKPYKRYRMYEKAL